MLTIGQLREEVGVEGRTVLSLVWSKYLSAQKWPSSRSIHSELSKAFVVAALEKTNGSVLFESVNNGTKEYQLVGVAPLLTDQGPQYQTLLLRFLEHLRHLYHTDPKKQTISGEEIETSLGLSKLEAGVLYHLILSGRLYSNSASRGAEGWNVGVFDESEDLPDGPLDQALETMLLRSYNPTYPIFYHDQMAKWTSPQSSSISPSMDAAAQPPNVFISYSHDSAEHKRWVLKLAEKLRLDGIKVLLDEWHVGPGGDVAFFMEESIAKADRVLLICTDKYVGKMDSRKGGVGYEAVLSTGELMRDVTTTKFIPVIRQKGKNPKIPRNMDTRYRINLSHRSSYAAEYEKLLRNLHGAPLNPEPPLGTNPYADTVAVAETESPVQSNDPGVLFKVASAMVRSDDYLGWRELLGRVKKDANERLPEIRQALGLKVPHSRDQELPYLHFWNDNYQSVYAVVLSGVMSGKQRFKDHVSLVEELLRPPKWSGTGHAIVTEMPEASVFLFHMLHGAVCLDSGQIELAVTLARTRFKLPSENEPERLFLIHSFNGWFNGTCYAPWLFLRELPKTWLWLNQVFGSDDNFLASICSYYCTLNLLELAHRIKDNIAFSHELQEFDVPLRFNFVEKNIAAQAYRLLATPGRNISEAWKPCGVTYEQMSSNWALWKSQCYRSLASLNNNQGVRKELLIHERLFEDVHP
jgi:hypothetical protein